jgi:hypothetical protein
MATGLKVGDKVIAKDGRKIKPDPQNPDNHLSRLNKGQVATVIRVSTGRAFIVEFNGKRGEVSAQQLVRYEGASGASNEATVEKSAAPRASVGRPRKESAAPSQDQSKGVTSYGTDLVNLMANKLLLNGGIQAGAEPVVELKLAELPPEVEKTLRALVEAKLLLGVQSLSASSGRSTAPKAGGQARRGRKPSAAKVAAPVADQPVKRKPGRPKKNAS